MSKRQGAGWMDEIGMAELIFKTNKPRKPISSSIVIRMPCLPLRCGTGRVGLSVDTTLIRSATHIAAIRPAIETRLYTILGKR
jgi:hypothetical protein